MSSSSDESDAAPERRKRNIRRLDNSSPSTSEGSPILGNSTKPSHHKNKVYVKETTDEESSDSSIVNVGRKRKKLVVLATDSEAEESSSSGSDIISVKPPISRLLSDDEQSSSSDFDTSHRKSKKRLYISDSELSSSDGEGEKCPICLATFRYQQMGSPEACDHMFCLECIQDWSKNSNTCPVDRQEFKLILVRDSYQGDVTRTIHVEKPVTNLDVSFLDDATYCEVCGSSSNEDRLLLCDGCDLGFHLYCLDPPLNAVPPGSWYCQTCVALQINNVLAAELEDQGPSDESHTSSDRRINLEQRNPRLMARTQQTERVRRRVTNNRRRPNSTNNQNDSLAIELVELRTHRVTSTTKSRRKKRKTRRTYRTCYEIDPGTGEAVAVKKLIKSRRKRRKKQRRLERSRNVAAKTVKGRLAAQLGICAPRNAVPQELPDIRIPSANNNSRSVINNLRYQAGIPALHLFGRPNEIDYFPDSDIETQEYSSGSLLTRRAPNRSDVATLNRVARLKAAVHLPEVVSSSTDILSNILDSQEKLHSRKTIFNVDASSGKLKIGGQANQNALRQRPNGSGGNNQYNSTNFNTQSSKNNCDYTSDNYYGNSHASGFYNFCSAYEDNNIGSSSTPGNTDVPQDYTRRTLCEAEVKPKDRATSSVSESDVDIYSDIEDSEAVTTTRDEIANEDPNITKQPCSEMMYASQLTPVEDEDNDSESGMVIDTDKHEETAVSSTVSDSVAQEILEPEEERQIEDNNQTIDDDEMDEDDGCPNASVYSQQQPPPQEINKIEAEVPKNDDDDDSNDGCPNFSIYSKESKNVAMTTDIAPKIDDDLDDIPPEPHEEEPEQLHIQESQAEIKKVIVKKNKEKKLMSLGLYSDSEDESVVKKSSGITGDDKEVDRKIDESLVDDKPANNTSFVDIKELTEDILSDEERSYTPCLDERMDKTQEGTGLDGLETELISDEERNDFDESHELKTVSEGDALEINAKESEMDFTRPEDYEEGEIVDKNKTTTSDKPEEEDEERVVAEAEEEDNAAAAVVQEDKEKKKKGDDKDTSNKSKKKKDKNKDSKGNNNDNDEDGNNKENENRESFRKLSKNTKERNYRDKDRVATRKSRSKSPAGKDKGDKEGRRKKEKRKELERYNVRALIAEKPRAPAKDEFGRDLRRTPPLPKSRSRSYTPPVVHRSVSRGRRSLSPRRRSLSKTRRSPSRHRSLSRTRRSVSRAQRSVSRTRRSVSKNRDKTGKKRGRSGSRSRRRSLSPRKRSRSKNKKRKRSSSKQEKRKKPKDGVKNKKRARSRSRQRSMSGSPSRRRRTRDWTPSFSRSPTPPDLRQASPSWTPPRVEKSQTLPSKNLTVIVNNDAAKKKKDKRRNKEKRKDGMQKKRRRERERTPPPSKEVFASGDNILVSVSFNNENETRDVTTREKKKKEKEKPQEKRRKKKQKKDLSGIKPVAIIDLDRSPFQEIPASPKDVIILSDSDNNETETRNAQSNMICDSSSQQVASPEAYLSGPKTPPEPQVKFSLNVKTPQMRAISNPLHEADDHNDVEEEMQQEINGSGGMHKGPNTPPEPPNSPPSSPDVYDPFEPTKSRSPTPEPQIIQNKTVDDKHDELLENRSVVDVDKSNQIELIPSLTPPVADIQPADSQSSIQVTPDSNKSPDQRIGVLINQQVVATAKPIAQTTPFSAVPTSIVTSTPISTNQAPQRINILNTTLITPPHLASSIPQRIVLPNQVKSSPVKISPTKAAVKSTPIKPMPSKGAVKSLTNKKSAENLDMDSPYSPGSSDYEDLFEPPTESLSSVKATKMIGKTSGKAAAGGGQSKSQNVFDMLFETPIFNKNKKFNDGGKSKMFGTKKNISPTKTKQVGIKIDEDSLKILEELPNSAVEMQVKDKFLKKLNRQERVVEEVKLVLKPYYNKKKITKDEYKDIMRRAVPKICHNKTGEINPTKIKHLVEAYVKKIKHSKKVTSSSSVPQKNVVN